MAAQSYSEGINQQMLDFFSTYFCPLGVHINKRVSTVLGVHIREVCLSLVSVLGLIVFCVCIREV